MRFVKKLVTRQRFFTQLKDQCVIISTAVSKFENTFVVPLVDTVLMEVMLT